MSLFEEEVPKKKMGHEIGCDLTMLSAEELRARISLLKEEIARLDTELSTKSKSRSAAEGLFKS
jgi:uncharacterized small protein (DUF1192 family)